MFGAILGDIVGSPYEFDCNNIKTKNFPLFSGRSVFTDDSVMTLAVAKGFMDAPPGADDDTIRQSITRAMRELGRRYPDAGYGARFGAWLSFEGAGPYNSFGNGSAMRVSSAAWLCDDLASVRHAARLSAEVTHNHPEGIKGAEATAAAIFLARTGHSKGEIRDCIEGTFGYDLSRTCDEIRPHYRHVESCQETVPEAITAFLEGESFEDVLRTAVSLGGDSDTLTAIAGSIAEGYYGVDEGWKQAAFSRLPQDLAQILRRFDLAWGVIPERELDPVHEAILFAERAHRGQKRKGSDISYITHPMEVLQILTAMGAGREVQIAGLLHDTVEDTGVVLEDVRAAFGDRVAALVAAHTEDKSKSWRERKQHTLDMLKTADRDTRLLILADKVSNLRSMASDYSRMGEALWDRFKAPRELQSWYNSAMQDALYDMQFDPAARQVYREMADLCRDLFMTWYADMEARTLYRSACGGATCVFRSDVGEWEPFEGEIPLRAVRVPRLRAQRLEEFWHREDAPGRPHPAEE